MHVKIWVVFLDITNYAKIQSFHEIYGDIFQSNVFLFTTTVFCECELNNTMSYPTPCWNKPRFHIFCWVSNSNSVLCMFEWGVLFCLSCFISREVYCQTIAFIYVQEAILDILGSMYKLNRLWTRKCVNMKSLEELANISSVLKLQKLRTIMEMEIWGS